MSVSVLSVSYTHLDVYKRQQKTSTSPYGRETVSSGYPVNMAEIMAGMPGVCYSCLLYTSSLVPTME